MPPKNHIVIGIFILIFSIFLILLPFFAFRWENFSFLFKITAQFWGITYFGFPITTLYLGILTLRGRDIYYFLNQSLKVASFLIVLLLINLCLLNIPAFLNQDWSGLFPKIIHLLFMNATKDLNSTASWKTLFLELVFLASYLGIFFREKTIKYIKEINMKDKIAKMKQWHKKIKIFAIKVWEEEKKAGAILKRIDINEETNKDSFSNSHDALISPISPIKETNLDLGLENTSKKDNEGKKDNEMKSDEIARKEAPEKGIEHSQEIEEKIENRVDLIIHSQVDETKDHELDDEKDNVFYDKKRVKENNEEIDFDFSLLRMGKEKLPEEDQEHVISQSMKIVTIDPEKKPSVLNTKKKHLKQDVIKQTADKSLLQFSEFIVRDNNFEESIHRTAKKLEKTIKEFGIEARVVEVLSGPVITQYEITIEAGVKISKIVNLADNIALSLAAPSVRIVAPIPGKGVIGIEIPNQKRQMVRLRDVLESNSYDDSKNVLPIALGKSILGQSVVKDLTATPHLLVAGATGSGKSVCVNSIITSLLIKCTPDKVRFIMIDPKMVELNVYNGIPHLLAPVVTDPKRASLALRWVIAEMESRYYLLEKYGARSIGSYNDIIRGKVDRKEFIEDDLGTLPYMVIIIDEFADLMMIARKEIEDSVSRLAAMSRAVGIHLILATQRPSVDVITGVIKANFPSRIAFQVSSKIDSRTIIDTNGADQLLGRGDMLYSDSGSPFPERIQGAFLSDEEVGNIVRNLKTKGTENYLEDIFVIGENTDKNALDEVQDELFDEAVWIVINDKKASASYLQRKLKIGYNRAARIVEKMEEIGIVGPVVGSKPREVLISNWQGIKTVSASVS